MTISIRKDRRVQKIYTATVLLTVLLSGLVQAGQFRADDSNTGYFPEGKLKQVKGVAYTYKTKKGIYSGPVVDGKYIYVGSQDGYLHVISKKTGTGFSKFRTKGNVSSTPHVEDGKAIFGSWDGFVYAVDFVNKKHFSRKGSQLRYSNGSMLVKMLNPILRGLKAAKHIFFLRSFFYYAQTKSNPVYSIKRITQSKGRFDSLLKKLKLSWAVFEVIAQNESVRTCLITFFFS